MPTKAKATTHHIRYRGKRGAIAFCGNVVQYWDEWVGPAVPPSCKKCRKTTRSIREIR